MSDTVWCVFQKLKGEACPSLYAICRSETVAAAVVEQARRQGAEFGEGESEWTVRAWGVLDGDHAELGEIERISHVLDPMRAALAVPAEGDEA